MFMQVHDLPKFASRSKLDGILWIGSFLAVIIMDIDTGLVISICLSLIILLYRSIAVKIEELGEIGDTGVFGKIKDFEFADRKENAILLNIGGPITFANFDDVLESVRRKLKRIPRTASIVVSFGPLTHQPLWPLFLFLCLFVSVANKRSVIQTQSFSKVILRLFFFFRPLYTVKIFAIQIAIDLNLGPLAWKGSLC